MRREELCNELKRQYKIGLASGVTKVDAPEYRNLWFVVPPPPPTTLKALPLKALATANRALNRLTAFEDMTALDRTITFLFARREAVASSRMEGTWSTIDHVLTPESLEEQNSDAPATASVRGYAQALEDAASKVVKRRHGSRIGLFPDRLTAKAQGLKANFWHTKLIKDAALSRSVFNFNEIFERHFFV